MKAVYLVSTVLLIMSCTNSKETLSQDEMMTVTGQITYTQDYCGGAPPSDQLLDKLRTPRPKAGLLLTLRAGKENTMDPSLSYEATTDEDGKFSIDVLEGSYVLLLPQHRDRTILQDNNPNYEILDRSGLESWWKSGIAKVDSKHREHTINLHQRCNVPLGVPHLRSTLPPPPAAPPVDR